MFRFVNKTARRVLCRRSFGSGHNHGPPGTPIYESDGLPVFHTRLANFFMVLTFVWIMYSAKEDKGKFLGLYKPWLDDHHDHEPHFKVTKHPFGDVIEEIEDEHEEEEE